MFEELYPMGLVQGARSLAVEPLELVRLMVLADALTPDLTTTPDQLAKLSKLGGIEGGWWDAVTLPSDANSVRARVRACASLLALKSAAGPVRMDNLWRGLAVEDQELIDDALNALADDGVVQIVNAPAGVQVHVDDQGRTSLTQIAAGTASSPALDELYQS